MTPTAKIDWVLEKTGLHDPSAQHELFELMRDVYPHATPKQRQAIIEEVSRFDLPGHDQEEIARTIAYQHFTWFTWLSDSDPECDLVRKQVEEIREQYPEFKPREWAGFPHYHTGGFVSHTSPWSTDKLLSKPAKEWAPKLLAFQDPDPFEFDRTDRIGLGNSLEEAASRDFQWGLELADTLAQSENWDTDLWSSLMKSWARQLGEGEQHQLLDRLLQGELHKHHIREVAETLTKLLREGKLSHSSGLLPKANQAALMAWESINPNEPVGAMEDWYGRAINHPAGMLTEFWMFSLSSWYNERRPRPDAISEEYREFMQKVVNDGTTAGRLGKSAIARQLSFLTAVDEDWVTNNLVLLFDSEDKGDRLAVWEGFLYEMTSPRVAEVLEKPFMSTWSDVDELFSPGSRSRETFVRKFTALVTHFVDEPLEEWIPKFFSKAQAEDRRGFALSISDQLRTMDPEPQRELWYRWLREYWENRQNGKPEPLDQSETRVMFYWLPHLHDLFPEAVELAIKTTNLPSDFSPTTYLRRNQGKAERYPEATAKLLIFLADQRLVRHAWLGTQELFEKLLNQNLPEDMEHRLRDIQVELGL